MLEKVVVKTPGKLILSGEHAVVYGKPALALAINRFVETTLMGNPRLSDITFNLSNLNYTATVSLQDLRGLKTQIQAAYNKFLAGECAISEVLKTPAALVQYVVIYIIDRFNMALTQGLEISINSDIPIGSGMGSSAATIVSVIQALHESFSLDIKPDDYLSIALEMENLQHGRSSGIDVYLATYGGYIRYENSIMTPRNIPEAKFYIVNTGIPEVSTGECISTVAKSLQNNEQLLNSFVQVTNDFDQALQNNDVENIKKCIRDNQQLLIKIGIVPAKVQNFVSEITDLGATAKICGAGSVSGQNAGVMLVLTDTDITAIVKEYDYQIFQVQGVISRSDSWQLNAVW